MAEEAPTTPVETDGAPVTETAAPGETEAPASPPEGFIDQTRYDELRREFNQRNNLIDRAKSGDNDALRELIGAEFAQDEEVPDLGDDDGEAEYADPVAREWIERQETERSLSMFNAHLDRLAGDPNLLDEFDRQALLQKSIAGGFNEQATEDAFTAWKKREDARQKKAVEDYIKSKKTSHVSAVGTGATEVPNLETHRDRVAHMVERLKQAQE